MAKEELIQDIETLEKESRKQKLQLSKFENADLERFSPSSYNAFMDNRMLWALRYIFKIKSRYPMFSAFRGNVIEQQIKNFLQADKPWTIEEYVQEAIEMYHHMIIMNLFQKGLYEYTARGFNVESLGTMLKGTDKEKFPSVVESILVTHNKLNSHVSLPAFTNPEDEDFGKYLKKLQKEYALIKQGVKEGINYFSILKGKKIAYQRRIEVMAYGLVIPTIAYSDFENDDDKIIYELKTVSAQKFPKEFKKISLPHKTQAAFNTKYRKRETKLIYITNVSEKALKDFHKDSFIFESGKQGLDAQTIFKSYTSPSGGGTTKKYVEEYLVSMTLPDFSAPVEPKPLVEYTFTLEDSERYDKVNYMNAQAINTIFEKSRKEHFENDIKVFCAGNPESMFVDKDQKEAIEKIWGIELQESEEDSE